MSFQLSILPPVLFPQLFNPDSILQWSPCVTEVTILFYSFEEPVHALLIVGENWGAWQSVHKWHLSAAWPSSSAFFKWKNLIYSQYFSAFPGIWNISTPLSLEAACCKLHWWGVRFSSLRSAAHSWEPVAAALLSRDCSGWAQRLACHSG